MDMIDTEIAGGINPDRPEESRSRLIERAEAIRDAVHPKSISARDVGSLFRDIVQNQTDADENTDRRFSEISANQAELASEFRREIVGLWDATAEMQAKLADLYSTETRNLLKRLGYEEEDIEEYIWAVGHLDLDITLDDLRHSVKVFERWKEGNFYCTPEMSCSVMPKWTKEMEDGDSTPLQLFQRLVYLSSLLKYLPHLDTSREYKDMWFNNFVTNLQYVGGVHARTDTEINIRGQKLRGIGSVTGRITRFKTQYGMENFSFIRKFKSDIPVNLDSAFEVAPNLRDLSGVDFSNAIEMGWFAYNINNPFNYFTKLCDKPLPQGIELHHAFCYRSFRDTTFVLGGYQLSIDNIFGPSASINNIHDANLLPKHDNCVIKLTGRVLPTDLRNMGMIAVPYGCRSRIEADNLEYIYPFAFVGCYDDSGTCECGVWEIDCPRLSYLFNFSLYSSASLLNIGENIPPGANLPLGYIMPRERKFAVESFRNSLKTWKPVPAASRPCIVGLFPEHVAVLSDEEIADLADKGYSISVYTT